MVRCLDCGETDPEKFSRAKGRSTGYQAYCKPCAAARARADRQKNAERYKEYNRQYYATHPEHREYRKAQVTKHRKQRKSAQEKK